MHSMTGFGRGFSENDAAQVTVEITSVNSKRQLELRFLLPREVAGLEPVLRNQIQQSVSRGSVQIALNYEFKAACGWQQVKINDLRVRHIVKCLRQVAAENELQADLSIGDLLAVPGVIAENVEVPLEQLHSAVTEALSQAIAELRKMQAIEGEQLHHDLCERRRKLCALLVAMRNAGSALVSHQRDQLYERIQKLGLELSMDDERLAKEVVFYAERSDITEELVRLESHLEQMQEMMNAAEPVGRALEFLCQEFNREITTILAKTGDAELADTALMFKVELGKIREQIQNIE